jgi:hypothetical protein
VVLVLDLDLVLDLAQVLVLGVIRRVVVMCARVQPSAKMRPVCQRILRYLALMIIMYVTVLRAVMLVQVAVSVGRILIALMIIMYVTVLRFVTPLTAVWLILQRSFAMMVINVRVMNVTLPQGVNSQQTVMVMIRAASQIHFVEITIVMVTHVIGVQKMTVNGVVAQGSAIMAHAKMYVRGALVAAWRQMTHLPTRVALTLQVKTG